MLFFYKVCSLNHSVILHQEYVYFNSYPRLIFSTAGRMWSGIKVRYLKVQCTSVVTSQAHGLGQSALESSAAARNNKVFSNHLCRYEELHTHSVIVHRVGGFSCTGN